MARPNFSFQKRQKEIAKKKKQEEKKQRKLEKKNQGDAEATQAVGPIDQEPVEETAETSEPAERPKPGVIPPSS